jgi:hypothetical protein
MRCVTAAVILPKYSAIKEDKTMPYNINLFDTYTMIGMVREIVPPYSFFRNRYFPTEANLDVYRSDKVLIEYQDGDRKLAPFVVPRAGDIPIDRKGYTINEYSPATIAPSRMLTLDDLNKRGFGEALFANSTAAERAAALQLRDLADLNDRILRREEWIAVQTMINNGCTMQAYIDNSTVGETFDINFYDITGDNPTIYTVGDEWNDTNGNCFGDVYAMCVKLAERGLPAADLVVGSSVASFFRTNEAILKLLDNRRAEFGTIAPKITAPGVTWYGRLNFDGFDLDIWIVNETYADDSGVIQKYFPAKSAMVAAPSCGHMMYGAVDIINDSNEFETIGAPRVPEFIVDKDKKTRKLRTTSRPLAAPKFKAPWIYAANVVK